MPKKWYRARRNVVVHTTAIGVPGSVHLAAGQIAELDSGLVDILLKNSMKDDPPVEEVDGPDDGGAAKAAAPKRRTIK